MKVESNDIDQRLDNYLAKKFKDLTRSKIYKIIRKGEVRINSKRISPFYKLKQNDEIRIPPFLILKNKFEFKDLNLSYNSKLENNIKYQNFKKFYKNNNFKLFEDDYFLIINKPSGILSHNLGIIEFSRYLFNLPNLSLANRLDKETSGCIILAKTRISLISIQNLIKNNQIKKIYLAILFGKWNKSRKIVKLSLEKVKTINQKTKQHSHKTIISQKGKNSISEFHFIKSLIINNIESSLMKINLMTGRMHQIRTHSNYFNNPILGDYLYASEKIKRIYRQNNIKKLYLHCLTNKFKHPFTGKLLSLTAKNYDF